jgi:O-antigen ligase
MMELTGFTRVLGISPAWQFLLASLGTMLFLALLDFVGAVFVKEWADTRYPGWFVLGLASFAILFVFYASSLRTAELSIVTIGWVVFLQVGLVLYERFRFGSHRPNGPRSSSSSLCRPTSCWRRTRAAPARRPQRHQELG